jgi:hypothetical protein
MTKTAGHDQGVPDVVTEPRGGLLGLARGNGAGWRFHVRDR